MIRTIGATAVFASLFVFVLLTSGPQSVVFADSLYESFDGGAIDSRLLVVADPGCAFVLNGGAGLVSKAAGVGNSLVKISTTFVLIGDFETTVHAERLDLSGTGELGLSTSHSSSDFTDVFFVDFDRIHSNILVDPVHAQVGSSDVVTVVTFRIRRVGQIIYEEYGFLRNQPRIRISLDQSGWRRSCFRSMDIRRRRADRSMISGYRLMRFRMVSFL